jgi:hypothetical protein
MKNVILTTLEAQDLRAQAEKVLRGLGNPEPPVDLQSVYELLRLDRQFYSSTDDGAIREFVSRVKVAGRQMVARPTLLIDVIRKAQLSALWVPDRKRILIDSNTPILKQRWYGAHEVGHSLIPWHEDYLYGDSEETLTPMCDEQLESEANYTAGQLLFMLDRFTRDALDSNTSLKSVRQLSKRFGNTITSTLWRFVEEAHHGLPLPELPRLQPPFLQLAELVLFASIPQLRSPNCRNNDGFLEGPRCRDLRHSLTVFCAPPSDHDGPSLFFGPIPLFWAMKFYGIEVAKTACRAIYGTEFDRLSTR